MTFPLIKNIAFFLLLGLLTFSSCTKDNSVTIIETEEALELGFRMTVRGTYLETNAVAAYCQNDNIEGFIISNKESLLEFPFNIQDFQEGDFAYFQQLDSSPDSVNWAYGGQGLGENITGFPELTISFSDADISIDSNDGTILVGSSSGTLWGLDFQTDTLIPYPYEMSFVAEIIAETSYCE